MKRILAVLAVVVAFSGWAGSPAAASGGWAVTYLDPGPSAYAGGTSYTLGFWVLQHGTHPFVGELDPVGLRFTRADGKSVTFKGTALPEAAHYAAAVVLPDGVWKVEGIQGWFQPYAVGTLTVPGAMRVDPVPPDMVATFGGSGEDYWGAVRPPGFPVGKPAPVPSPGSAVPSGAVPSGAVPSGAASAVPVPAVAASPPAPGGDGEGVPAYLLGVALGERVPAYLLGVAALGGALVVAVVVRPLAVVRWFRGLRTVRRREEEPPAEGGTGETLVIGG